MYKLILLAIIVIILAGCRESDSYLDEMPIVRVFDKRLYLSEVADAVPNGLNPDDSVSIAKKYIDNWIKKQLKVNKAELNLPEAEKNLTKQLEDYRASLLVYKYEQQIIAQKLDTNVTDKEIENYYNKYSSGFKLDNDVVRADYVKILKNTPDNYKVRNWMRSDKDNDKILLLEYCDKYAEEYSFNTDWDYLNTLMTKFPIQIYGPVNQYLKYNNFIETKDSTFRYFIIITDYRLTNDTTPLSLVKDKIAMIVLNKKKIELIFEMEDDITHSALKQGNLEIYLK